MSRLAHALVLGATLAVMNLAGMTAVGPAHADEPVNQDVRRPPTEAQVGEAWRHRQSAAEHSGVASDTRKPPTEAQVGEAWRHRTDTAPLRPAEPSGRLIGPLGALAAALALAGGLAVLAARRTSRRARVEQTA